MSSIPNFDPLVKIQFDTPAVDALGSEGGRFALIKGEDGKNPFYPGWQKKCYLLTAARKYARRGKNIGILTGAPSGNRGNGWIICFDLDHDFRRFLEKYNIAGSFYTTRANAPERGKVFIRVTGRLPKSTSWRPDPADKSPRAELLSTGRQAVIHGTNYHGAEPTSIDFHGDTLIQLTYEQVQAIWEDWTKEEAAPAPDRPTKPKRLYHPQGNRERIERIKAAWPSALAVFAYHNLATEIVPAPRQEKRIKGQGGLLVGEPSSPNGWQWFNFADWVGGDQIDAFGYCLYGRQWNRYNTTLFKQVLTEMERAAGIEPEPPQPKKTTAQPDADKESSQPDPGAPAGTAEDPQPVCGKWIRSHIKTSDGGYKIILTQGLCGRNNCAHCARVTDAEKYSRILKHIDVEGWVGTWSLSIIDKGDYTIETRARRESKARYVSLIGKNANRGKVLLLTEDPDGAATMDEIRGALLSYLDQLPDLDAPPRARLMRFSKGFFDKAKSDAEEPEEPEAPIPVVIRDQWGRSADDYRDFIAMGGETEQVKRWRRALADLEALEAGQSETGAAARHVEHVGETGELHAKHDDVPFTLQPYLDRTTKINLDHQALKAILEQIGAKATYRGRYCYIELTESQTLQWVELVYHAAVDQRRAA